MHDMRTRTLSLVTLLAALGAAPAISRAEPIPIAEIDRTTPVSFEKEILPVFRQKCLACHSASEQQGGLVLETAAAALKGGNSGPAVVAGKSGESLLLELGAHQSEPFMPPPGNDVAASDLSSQELGLIRKWIDEGAAGGGTASLSPQNWRALPERIQPVLAAVITQDGQYAACSRGNRIFIYHVATGQLVAELTDPALAQHGAEESLPTAHLDLVPALAFNTDGDVLASGSFREVKIWRRPRDVRLLELAAGSPGTATAVSHDSQWVAVAAEDHVIRVWTLGGDPAAAPILLSGHTDVIRSLRFLPDGLLASASRDGSIRIWNTGESKLVGRLDAPTPLNAVELVATGREDAPYWLVSGGDDNLLRVWSVPDSAAVPLEENLAAAQRLALNADRTQIAVAAANGAIQVRDAVTRAVLKAWQGPEGEIRALAFQPVAAEGASPLVATAGADGQIRLWSAQTGELQRTLSGSLVGIESLAFTPDGARLVAGAADGAATIWTLSPSETQTTPAAGAEATLTVSSTDGRLLASALKVNGQPAVVVRNAADGAVTRTLTGHTGDVLCIAFSGDASKIATGSVDQTVRVWNLNDANAEPVAFAEHAGAVRGVAFSADGARVLSGAADNSVKLWNAADATLIADCPGHTAPVVAVAFTAGDQPTSASADHTVRFWNPSNGQQTRAISDPAAIVQMGISRDGALLALSGDDKAVRIYQAANGQLLQTLPARDHAATSLNFSADGARLLALATGQSLTIWETATGRVLQEMVAEQSVSGEFGADAQHIRLTASDGSMTTRGLEFMLALRGMTQPVTGLATNADGQQVYAASADGTIRGYQTGGDGNPFYTANHGAAIRDLALSPNGQVLATAGENGTIRLWQSANGAGANPQIPNATGPVQTVAWSLDGLHLIAATGGEQPDVHVFDAATGVILERVHGDGTTAADIVAGGDAESGTTLFMAAGEGGVRTATIHAVRTVPGHSGAVTSLAAIPETPLQVLSGSLDGTLRRWNLENGQAILQLNHGSPIQCVAVRPDAQRYASAGDNGTTRLWNAANNQPIDLRGDLRLRTLVARLQQQQNAATARQAAAQQRVTAAEQDLTAKTQAEQTLNQALATANTAVTQQQAAFKTANDAKVAAEKAAVEAAAVAQKAALAKEEADALAMTAAEEAQRAQMRASQLATAAQSQPDNQDLAASAAAAQQAAQDAATKSQAATAAQTAPAQAAQQTAEAANQAASKAVETQKPYNDALTALKQAESTQNLAAQQHAVAVRELAAAQAEVPAAKESLTAADAALAEVKQQFEQAQQESTAAELPQKTVAFSPDGRTLATGGDYPSVHTWDAETGAPIAAFAGHAGPIHSATFAGPELLVSLDAAGNAIQWETNPKWQLERSIGAIDDPTILVDRVLGLDFSDDGGLLAVGGGVPSRSGQVKVFNVADGSVLFDLPEAHLDSVFAVSISPDGKRLASAGADKYLRTFSLPDGAELRRFEGHTNYVLGTSWKSDGQLLVSSSADGTIKVWNPETGDQFRTIEGFGKAVTCVRFIGDTEFIVSACGDRLVRQHNANNGGQIIGPFDAQAYLHCVDATPNRQLVIAGGQDGVLRIWNGTNNQMLQTLGPDSDPEE